MMPRPAARQAMRNARRTRAMGRLAAPGRTAVDAEARSLTLTRVSEPSDDRRLGRRAAGPKRRFHVPYGSPAFARRVNGPFGGQPRPLEFGDHVVHARLELLAHPASRYFSIGRIGRDQVEDYAERKGEALAVVERWLRPNLAYDPR